MTVINIDAVQGPCHGLLRDANVALSVVKVASTMAKWCDALCEVHFGQPLHNRIDKRGVGQVVRHEEAIDMSVSDSHRVAVSAEEPADALVESAPLGTKLQQYSG